MAGIIGRITGAETRDSNPAESYSVENTKSVLAGQTKLVALEPGGDFHACRPALHDYSDLDNTGVL